MRRLTTLFLTWSLVWSLVACGRSSDDATPGTFGAAPPGGSAKPRGEQIAPPVDLKAPPADATKTASGLAYKRLVSNDAGAQPRRNDTVLVNYTGWRPSTGTPFIVT